MPRHSLALSLDSLSGARRRVRWSVCALAGSVSLALVVSLSAVEPATAAPTPPSPDQPAQASDKWVEPTGTGLVRPDFVSASVTARSSGQRVEVLSERSETSRTWAIPTGGYEAEASSAPVRFTDARATATEGWRDIDLTLVKNGDGSVSPKAVPGKVALAGGGKSPTALVTVTRPGLPAVSLGAGVNRLLPEPVLEGATATYPDVLPGVDIRVEVRPTGFEQLWVVKTREALTALLAAQVGGKKAVVAGLQTGTLSATPQAGGGVEFTDGKGKAVARLAPPQVWDAVTTPSGEPAQVADADFVVTEDGSPLTPKVGGSGELQLAVVPDQAWLADPARKFPITIDPTYLSASTSPVFDTWVQEDETGDKSISTVLPVGMDSLGVKGRSFLNFSTAAFTGKTITAASLVLWSTSSGSCTPNGWSSYDSGVASTSTRWTAQPTLGSKFATSTQTKGFSSACPDGSVSIDMKAQLQSWANQAATTKGMTLRSDNETSYTYFHLFHSSDASTNQPLLKWSYDRPPTTPAAPTVAGTVSYQPSGSTASYLYTADRRPNLSAVVSDPDLDTVKATFSASTTNFGSTASTCTTPLVASGSSAGCELATDLAADGRYYVRGQSIDQPGKASGYGPVTELRVAAVTPAAPVVSCPAPYSNGSWQTTGPTSNITCTISAAGTGYSAPSRIAYSIDGNPVYTYVNIPQSSSASVAKATVTVPTTEGGHSIRAYAFTPTGLYAASSYYLGWGSVPLLKRPHPSNPRITTTDKVEMNAAGPAQTGTAAATATTQWRVSGATGTAGWIDAPAGNPLTVAQGGGQSQASGMFDTTSIVGQTDSSGVTVNGRVPTLIDVRVCITLSTGTGCSGQATVLRVPHAFGGGFPTADAGPGQVALWTGELQVDDADAELATPDGSLSVSRSHTSFAGTPAPQNRVFGPGWTASFDGDGSGAGGAELYDGTADDGSLAVLDADGGALVFTTPTGARRTSTALPTGTYKPADTETRTAGMTLTVSGSGAATVAELTGEDGVVTKFQVTAAPTTAAATFKTVEVREPAVPGKTTYSYDTAGRVTAITAPLPDGVTACTPGTATAGCRVLKIAYAAATTATATAPGDYAGQVKQITAQVNTDPDRTLATFKYDTGGRLVQATDARTGLATEYGWTGTGTSLRLATFTPPGQAAYTFEYDTTANKLAKVTRPNPASAGGGTAQLGAYLYGVPRTGTVTDLPDLAVETGKWNQGRAPTWAAAVFGQDTPISGAPAANAPEWRSADLQFTDSEGYTVNTASYGAGAWQLTAIDYDTTGNPVRSWDERATAGIRDGSLPGGGAAPDAASLTVYNPDITGAAGAVVTPAGSLVTDTYSPVHEVTADDGTLQMLRTHTHTSYDQGAPNGGINPVTGQPYRLPTRTVTTAETAGGAVDATLASTFAGYDPVAAGDKSGWELGQATTTTLDTDLDGTKSAGDITTTTRYDDRGRVIENRQPKSDGTDAGTRVTSFYTADASGGSTCGSKPAWAGMTCRVGPAAQPAGQTMSVTTTAGYTWDLQGTSEAETSGSVIRTTTIGYDAQDRPVTVAANVTGLTGSQPVPTVTTSYDPATGAVNGTSSTAGTTATTFDSWGRQLTYANTPAGQTADTATTTYDPAGRVTSVVDNNGATSYTYDGTDADGKAERRGVATAVKVKLTGGTEYTSTGAYDPAGDLTLEKLPGNLIRRTGIDVAGDQTELTVNGQAANPDTGNLEPDQPWFGWSTRSNAASQIVHEWTPNGAGTDGALGATVIASDRNYRYDRAGRLTRVQDITGDTPCVTRTYDFDANGNRTSQASAPAATDGTCTTTGGTITTRAYDTADRPTTSGSGTGTGNYLYDELGRQTTIPAADALHPDRGDLKLSYYDTDAAHTISQGALGAGGTKTTFTLDSAGRRLTQSTQTDIGTSTLVRHYADTSDNPSWSVDTTAGLTTSTRYAELVSGDLGLTLTATGTGTGTGTQAAVAELALTTPRGDTATTITLPSGATGPGFSSATGIDSWTDYTEYGQPGQTVDKTPGGTTGIGYGWLGAEQRATTETGLILMGARLYNPATGLFTSVDPVLDGGDTRYAYPNDPIQMQDTDGQFWGSLCRLACKPIGKYLWKKALKPAGKWGWKKAKSGWSKAKHKANNNNFIRCCRDKQRGEFRVAAGRAYKHWKKKPRWYNRFHGHFGRSYGGVGWHTRNKSYTWTWWKKQR